MHVISSWGAVRCEAVSSSFILTIRESFFLFHNLRIETFSTGFVFNRSKCFKIDMGEKVRKI